MLYLKNNLLLAILNNGQAEHFMNLARENGAAGGTVIPARGTASNAVLNLLGLGDKKKEMVLVVAQDKNLDSIIESAKKDEKISGVSAVIESSTAKGKNMENTKLITVIVNNGYSDDVMEAARKAGAKGGTITHARGTATKGHEEHFINMTIVPEKEMVMILAKEEETENIVNAILSLECLNEPAMGILYVQDVSKFVNLGSEK